MYVYMGINIGIFVTSIFFENIFFKIKMSRDYSRLAYYFWSITLLVLSAFRYGIGNDYFTYYEAYTHFSDVGTTTNLLIWFIHLLFELNLPYQIAIIISSCSFLLPIMYLIYKLNYRYKLFSLGILLGFEFYIYSYNVFRQYMATGLMLLFIYKWAETHRKRLLLALVIPIAIHPSSIIAIIIYYLLQKIKVKFSTLQKWSYVGITSFLLVPDNIAGQIISIMMRIFNNTIYSNYVYSSDSSFMERIYNQSMEFLPKVLIIPMLLILPYVYRNTINNKSGKQYTLLIKVYYTYFLAMSLKFGSEIVSRFLMYFSLLGVLVIPMMAESLQYTSKRRLIRRGLFLLVIILSIYTQIKVMQVNGCQAYPYQSILW